MLPIPGEPLQARYFGPYVVKERKSEKNYVVITPDRLKDKQLCHINMLKPYFERNSQVKTHLVNAVSLHPGEENDVSEHSSPSDTSKLTVWRQFLFSFVNKSFCFLLHISNT